VAFTSKNQIGDPKTNPFAMPFVMPGQNSNPRDDAVIDFCQNKSQVDELNLINDEISKFSKKISLVRLEIHESEQKQAQFKDLLFLDNEEMVPDSEYDKRIQEFDEHILKLKEFENNHLINYILSLESKIGQVDQEVARIQPNTDAELENLIAIKKEYEERFEIVYQEYDRLLFPILK
jgi:hypothetical protein